MAYTVDEATINQVKDFVIAYHKKHMKAPQFSDVMGSLNLEKPVVYQSFRALTERGVFKRNYSQYKVKIEAPKEPVKTITEQVRAKIKKWSLDDIFIGVLRVVMLLVGIGAIIMLSLFAYTWGKDHMENDGFAFVLSLTLMIFSVCAFQVATIYSQNGEGKMATVFFIAWLVVLLFSMQSSVSYMYNASNAKKIAVVISSNDVTRESLKWNDLLKRESEKETDIKNLKERLIELNSILSQYITPEQIEAGKKIYDDTNKKVSEQEKKIKEVEKELNTIRDEKEITLNSEQQAGVVQSVKRDDFYTAAGKLLGMKGDTLEFLVSCFPAMFFDLVAPLSISVALFLKRRDKQKSRFVSLLEKIFIKGKVGDERK